MGERVDAPVSGGPFGAERGTLTVMASGDAAGFERARPPSWRRSCPGSATTAEPKGPRRRDQGAPPRVSATDSPP